jgi:hypothetical protein
VTDYNSCYLFIASPPYNSRTLQLSNMKTEASLEDLRPQVLLQALQQISSTLDTPTECCIICLGDLTEQCEALPCRHNNFDFICLVTWLQQRATCPLCKTAVQEVRYELSDDNKQGKIYRVPEPSKESNESNGQSEESLRRSPWISLPRNGDHYDHSTTIRQPHGADAIQKRRFIYYHNLYSLHIGSNKRQPVELYHREVSPQTFMTDLETVHRARKWLRRELRVFQFLNISHNALHELGSNERPRLCNSEYLLEYIIAILKNIDVQDSSGQAEDLIREFLGRKYTRLILHELKAWLRSSYTSLIAWDCNVQYHNRNALPSVSQDTATETVESSYIALKYHEPTEARKPPSSQAWQLYVLKGDDILEVIELWERSVWLLGREERVVDIVIPHPSCSGQHAALQFRYVAEDYETSQEMDLTQDISKSGVGLYLIDLNSTHGTILNGERIKSNNYVKVRHRSLIVFGGSKREYVAILPPNTMENQE